MDLLKDSLIQRTALAELPKNLVPDGFLEDLAELARHVPEYGVWQEVVSLNDKELAVQAGQTRRAIADVNSLVFFGEGKRTERYSDKQIAANLEGFRVSARARIEQIAVSILWKDRAATFERNDRHRQTEAKRKKASGLNVAPLSLAAKPLVVSTEEEFNATPRTIGKTIQRKFAAPTDRIAFNRRFEGERIVVPNLIFDPRRITETDLKNLGLVDGNFLHKKRGAERLEAIAGKIGDLKKALGMLNPLRDDFPIKDRFGQHRLYTSDDGHLIGTTNNSGKPSLFKANLVDGYHRLIHIDERQVDEKEKLIGVLRKIDALMQMIRNNWSETKRPEKLEEMKKTLLGMIDDLGAVRDADKVALIEAIEKSLNTNITNNPGARLALLASAKQKVNGRLIAMDKIAPYIRRDREDVEKEKRRHDNIRFEELFLYVESMAGRREKIKTPIDQQTRAAIHERLEAWAIEFRPANGSHEFLEPYRTFCDTALQKIEQAKVVVLDTKNSNADVARAVLKLYLVAKLQVVWSRIVSIYEKFLIRHGLPYFIDLKNELKELREALLAKNVVVKGSTPEFDYAFSDLTKLVKSLELAAEEGRKLMADKKPAEAKLLREKMSEKVSELDIIRLVKSIGG